MKPEIKQVIEWLLAQGLSPLPVAPQQDSRKYPKVNLGNGKKYDHCPLDENLNPIPLYTGKNPSYLNKSGEPNLVNHSNYQNKQPSESILKRWFQNPNNGIGALGKDDFCWLDLDSKCFESQTKCETALNKIFERCPELMNGILEKTHSGGFRLGFRVKEPKSFTNFAVEIGGKHVGELLGAGRFAVLAPSVGPSGNSYVNISRPEKLPVIEKIDFVYPVGQTTSVTKPVKPVVNSEMVHSSSQALDLRDLLNDEAFAVLNGSDTRNDESFSLCMLFKDAKGWENWLQNKNIPFGNSAEALTYYGGSNLGLDDAKCDRVMKSVQEQENLQPAAFFKGGDKSCWLKVFKLSKQIYGDYCPASMKDLVCGRLEKIQINPQTGEDKMTDKEAIAILEKELSSEPLKVKTKTPLQAPTTYTDDPTPDEPSDKPDEPIILPPSYPYNVRAVKAIYGRGHFISFEGNLYEYTGKHYEKLDPSLEMLKIRGWAEKECVWNEKDKQWVYKYLAPQFLKLIWEWALMDHAVSSELINPPGLNLSNGTLKLKWEGKNVSWELKKHSHKDYYLFCSAVEFNPDANPEACDRLLEVLDPIPRTVFLRTIAASLDLEPIRELHGRPRALISRGGGSNGKDSVKEAVARIFTSALICSCPFTDFSAYDMGRKFDLTKLKNKKINWASENNRSTVLDVGDALNAAISGEELDFEKKGKDSDPYTPACIHIFNVNKMPKIKSGLDSIKTRFAVLDFNKTFASKPDPSKGELYADPRFKYSPQFVTDEVCPALLNRILEELLILAKEGINYEGIASSFEDIQEDSNHLWSFVKDSGIIADPNGKIYVKDLWEILKTWYIDNETLEITKTNDGGIKTVWHEQSNKYDRNVTYSNQVAKRIKELFPKTKTDTETRTQGAKGRSFIQGITFAPSSPHHPHHLDTVRVSSSPQSSLISTHPYSPPGEDGIKNGEDESEVNGEVETLAQSLGEDGGDEMFQKTPPANLCWKLIHSVGLENLYRGDWIALADGIPLKLEKRTKNFWYAAPENSKDSLEVPFSEIVHVYR